jgi:hypothetical protein
VSEPAAFLLRLTTALDEAGIPHMLTGSFASSLHGSPRATQDIDLVIDPTFQSLARLLEALGGADMYLDADVAREEHRRRGQFDRAYIEHWLDDLDVRELWARVLQLSRRGDGNMSSWRA